MTYKIVNPRIGEPGTEFVPDEGVNVDALIEAGFIIEGDKHNKKSAKTEETISQGD